MTQSALVLGITGGFGEAVARALLRHGWKVRTLMRNPSKLATDLHQVEVTQGDASDASAVSAALLGQDVLVYGINVPYQDWSKQAMPLLEISCKAAEHEGARILFPGNVYLYDPRDKKRVSETGRQHPPTAKGVIRQEMENRLQQAARQGARVLILRAGDFFGTGSSSSWMNEIIKPGKNKIQVTFPADPGHRHAFAYLPDMAETALQLLEKESHLQDFDSFHFKGHETSLDEIASCLDTMNTGLPIKRRSLPWPIFGLLALFIPMIREVIKMRYLWQQELFLENGKLISILGTEPHTPLPQALRSCLPVKENRQPARAIKTTA